MNILLEVFLDALLTACYFGVVAVITLIIKYGFKLKREWYRKTLHLFFMGSIIPFLYLFDYWYTSVITMALFMIFAFVGLSLLERYPFYTALLAERKQKESKQSIALAFFTYMLITGVIWGIFGGGYKYIILAAILSWGIGDALAALVGQREMTSEIKHRMVKNKKTIEGTLTMFISAFFVIFLVLYFVGKKDVIYSVLVSLLVALIGAFAEVVSSEGTDTLWVPIVEGTLLLVIALLWSPIEIVKIYLINN